MLKIVKNFYFEGIIIISILVSSICLAIDNPLNNPKGTLSMVLEIIDDVLTLIFTIEIILKVFAYGFLFNGKNSYLRVSENLVDFSVVCFSIVDIIF